MNSRAIGTRMEGCNLKVLATLFKLPFIRGPGIDLKDSKIGVEMKGRYDVWTHTWTVHSEPIDIYPRQNPSLRLYWALMLYGLSKPPSKIAENISDRSLEQLVTERTLWLVEWDWMREREVWYPKTGPYCYPKRHELPNGTYFDPYTFDHLQVFIPRRLRSLKNRLFASPESTEPF